jgi:hypothetical protein
MRIHLVVRHGEPATADVGTAENYITEFSGIIKEFAYSSKQVFNVDDTGLFW